MKYCIEENVAKRHHLSINELLGLMIFKNGCNPQQLINRMLERELIVQDMFGNWHYLKDIKMITTNNALKWLKFKDLNLMGNNLQEQY